MHFPPPLSQLTGNGCASPFFCDHHEYPYLVPPTRHTGFPFSPSLFRPEHSPAPPFWFYSSLVPSILQRPESTSVAFSLSHYLNLAPGGLLAVSFTAYTDQTPEPISPSHCLLVPPFDSLLFLLPASEPFFHSSLPCIVPLPHESFAPGSSSPNCLALPLAPLPAEVSLFLRTIFFGVRQI